MLSLLKTFCPWDCYFFVISFLCNICFLENDSFRYVFSMFHKFHKAFIVHRKNNEKKIKQNKIVRGYLSLNSQLFSPSQAVLSQYCIIALETYYLHSLDFCLN